jgi:hypothetical protein
MTREIYLNIILPLTLVVVGFSAAWLQGRQVDRRDREHQHRYSAK